MAKNKFKVIGVMSGTSLDGIDLVYVIFEKGKQWQFDIVYSETVAYPKFWVEQLRGLVANTFEELKVIDVAYTKYLAGVIAAFIEKYNLNDIDAVCSHGHTALHQPEKKLTYQIGNLQMLAEVLGQKVVCDFRVQDVEYGGQGAPLVPIGDKLLFSDYDFCLNLGGFANISTDENDKRIAYDICPVNIVLNHYVKQLGFDYDDSGTIAASGSVNAELLDKLNALGFYKEAYPKSLGLEWVKVNIFPLIDAFQLEIKDILSTFVEHIAIQLAAEINKKELASVYVTGGGVYNVYLIERLKHYTNNTILIPENAIVEFKEALIFGFLGVLKLRNENNCLQSVTGANRDHSSGKIYLPEK
ncbi:anhydro-N-acetylmuramic acid kinase [Aestuariibaculum sp. M13]|uniref:anhydro-N-acetylmuramic acid kinase n=1 Tax=Aestuariibaculum sp. M13 TaxID=2967132 RepID=UPI002159FA84|nr:anhydro-N-acetylmuramic acid kinase [Aestuariibaculum sp. M13]MCR8666688.1 anhydro-N-acetylmuramic acid kinase [Aestuariibaculum sp. M13]